MMFFKNHKERNPLQHKLHSNTLLLISAVPIYPISVVPPDLYLILWPAVAAVIKEMMENVSGMYSPPAVALMIYSPTIVSLSKEEAGRSYGTARDTHVHT